MNDPTTEEILNSVYIEEKWHKDSSGSVIVRRWITFKDGKKKFMGEEETLYKDVPYVIMKYFPPSTPHPELEKEY